MKDAAAAAGLLLDARRLAWRHRWRHMGAAARPAPWAAAALAMLGLLWLGHAQADALLAPALKTATPSGLAPRGALTAGAQALEIAFWLTALLSAVSSFRVMELLFRRQDARALQTLPLPIEAMLIDRVVSGLVEACLLSALCALPFAPLIWRGAPQVALLCALMIFLGQLATLAAGLATQLWAGASEYAVPAGAPPQSSDTGQLFLYAPGAALCASVILDLLIKLGLGEWLRTGVVGRPTALVLGLVGAASLVGAALGLRAARSSYLRMLAGFREADSPGLRVEIDYQHSALAHPKGLIRLAAEPMRTLLQRHHLQYSRRFMLSRYGYGLVWLVQGACVWSLDPEALPDWALLAAPWLILACVIAPWLKLDRPGLRAPRSLCLPLDAALEDASLARFAALETLRFTLPLATITALLAAAQGRASLGHAALLGGLMILGALAQAGAASLGWRVLQTRGLLTGALALLVALSAGALAAWTPWASAPLALLTLPLLWPPARLSAHAASPPSASPPSAA